MGYTLPQWECLETGLILSFSKKYYAFSYCEYGEQPTKKKIWRPKDQLPQLQILIL